MTGHRLSAGQAPAEYLVVRGFLGPVIVQMPSAEIRRQLVEIIDRKLSGLEGSQED